MMNYKENNVWIVYVHIIPKVITGYNNDKYYVGITNQKPNRRWKNGYGYRHQSFFYNAIQKYGWDNIEHHIIASNLTKSEACNMESILINKLNSNNKKHGYNLTNGGDGVCGYKFTDEQLEIKRKNSMGKNNPFYGRTHTEETKIKMSKNHYDCKGYKNPRAKPIYRFDSDCNFIEKYPSSIEANKALGCNFSAAAALNGSLCADSYWAREENVIIDENGIRMKNPPSLDNKKDIFQFDENWVYVDRYTSGKNASESTGFGKTTINESAKKKVMRCGYYWLRRNDIELIDSVPSVKESTKIEIINNAKDKDKNLVPVVNITTMEYFDSLARAASIYKVQYSNIRTAAKELSNGHKRTCKGCEWLLYKDYLDINNLTDIEARKNLIFIK